MTPEERAAAVNAMQLLGAPAVQVWRAKENGGLLSEGTATALKIGSQLFLLTADHVLAPNAEFTYYVMDDTRHLTELICNDTARDARLDFAVLRLSIDMQRNLTWVPAATYSQLRMAKPAPGTLATFVGFPSGRNAPNPAKNKTTPAPYSYTRLTIKRPDYEKHGYDVDTHIMIPFRRKRVTSLESGALVRFPEPYGMSGGPVWLRPSGKPPRVIGIGLKASSQKAIMVGGLIHIWIAAMRQHWPDMDALLPT